MSSPLMSELSGYLDSETEQDLENFDPLDKTEEKEFTEETIPKIGSLLSKSSEQNDLRIQKILTKGTKQLEKKSILKEKFESRINERNFKIRELGFSDPNIVPRNLINLFIGDDAQILGFKWDTEGVSWNLENAKQTWAEEPLWINVLRSIGLGLDFFPVISAVNKSLKVGRLGQKFGTGFKFIDWTNNLDDMADPTLQLSKWFKAFSNETDEISWLAQKGFLNPEIETTKKALKQARILAMTEQKITRNSLLSKAIASGQESYYWAGKEIKVGSLQKLRHWFDSEFANSYWKVANATQPSDVAKFGKSLDEFYKTENLGRFFTDIPEEITTNARNTEVLRYWLDPTNYPLPADVHPTTVRWAVGLREAMEVHQKQAFELGMIDSDTLSKIPRHIPAQWISTPVPSSKKGVKSIFSFSRDEPEKAWEFIKWPDLESTTLLHREKSLPEILQILNQMDSNVQTGKKLITDPINLTFRGYFIDRQLYHNFKFMKDFIKDSVDKGLSLTDDIYQNTIGRTKMAGYISLERMPGREILRRIFAKNNPELLSDGKLPWILKAHYDSFFGKEGMFVQTQTATDILAGIISFHKTMSTSMNPNTQLQNLIGNQVFLSWGGVFPLDPNIVNIGEHSNAALMKILHLRRKNFKAVIDAPQDLVSIGAGLKEIPNEIIDQFIINNKIKLGTINVFNSKGKKITINLNDHFATEAFKQLTEYSSFAEVEGLKHIQRIYDRMRKGGFGKKVIGSLLSLSETPVIGSSIRKFSDFYLAGDYVPKTQMYFKYIAEGLSPDSAAMLTARYMPMYHTTGKFVTGSRRIMLPWITFPSEVLRIAKNQMMDNPLKILPWLHAVDIIQSLENIFGGETPESVVEAKRNLPYWAQTPQTIVGESKDISQTQGLIGGGAGGAALAAILKGGGFGRPIPVPGGAFTGTLAGALAGYLIGSQAKEDKLRGALVNWLPLSSLNLGIDYESAPEYYQRLTVPKMIEASPVEPLAIMKPLLEILSGQTAYGEEIEAKGTADHLRRVWAGLVGFVSPPLIHTYGFKVTAPDEQKFRPYTTIGGTAIGAGIGYSAAGIPGAVAGAAVGSVTGASANIARIPIDLGLATDPRTMELKEAPVDFILNNFGLFKSYAASPSNRAMNQRIIGQELKTVRSSLKKQASYYIVNNNEDRAYELLAAVKATFIQEYPFDPKEATEKWSDWADSFIDEIGESPMWRGMSKKHMKSEILRVKRFEADNRSQALNEWVEALRLAMKMR